MAVDVGRKAELPHQHHRALREIVGQQRGAVAAVIGLASLRLPLAIGAPPLEGGGFQRIVIVGEQADVFDTDTV